MKQVIYYILLSLITISSNVLTTTEVTTKTQCFKEKATLCEYNTATETRSCNTEPRLYPKDCSYYSQTHPWYCHSIIDAFRCPDRNQSLCYLSTKNAQIDQEIIMTLDCARNLQVNIENVKYILFHGPESLNCHMEYRYGSCTAKSCKNLDCCPGTDQKRKNCTRSFSSTDVTRYQNICNTNSLQGRCWINFPRREVTVCDNDRDFKYAQQCLAVKLQDVIMIGTLM